MKILHLIIDHQVVERTMGIYEQVFPGCNDVIIFDITNAKFKHLKNIDAARIVRARKGLEDGTKYDFSGYTHIVAHLLTMDMIDFIKSAPSNIHVCWEIYGWDLYNQFEGVLDLDLYYVNPKKYDKNSKHSFLRTYAPHLFEFALKLKGYKYRSNSSKRKQLNFISNRINSIQACCKYDAVCLMKYAKREIPWFESFNYSLTETLGELVEQPFFDGKDILIGNSASLSNNHLYVLEKIKDISFPNESKIIMPLSYGGIPCYVDDVKKAYQTKFGDKMEFITEYMPLHEYNKIFLRQKAMVLSAWRQESIGTVIMGLYLGVKVFMSERSPLYKWMHECGFILKTIESACQEDFATRLSDEEKTHNRNLVLTRYKEEVFAETLKKNFE